MPQPSVIITKMSNNIILLLRKMPILSHNLYFVYTVKMQAILSQLLFEHWNKIN